MLDKLGTLGLVGVLVTLGGLALIAWQSPIVAGGLALVVGGVGLVVKGLLDSLMAQFGFA